MARDSLPTSFVQRTPNVLLGRHFQDRRGVSKEIAFAEPDESGGTAGIILEAFSGLPGPQQDFTNKEGRVRRCGIDGHRCALPILPEDAADARRFTT